MSKFIHVTAPDLRKGQPPASTSASTATPMATPSTKRKAPPDHPDSAKKRATRQDPVSCESCRRKKLKCNRQHPCSSCVTRRLNCSYGVIPPAGDASRVEARVEPRNVPDGRNQQCASEGNTPLRAAPQPSRPGRESVITADLLETIHMGARVASAAPRWLRNGGSPRTLGDISTQGFRDVPGALLSISSRNWSASLENPVTMNLISFLPTKREAMSIFRYYADYVDYFYHIVFLQRVESQVNGVYRCLETGEPINLSHLALFFSIAASSLYLQVSQESALYGELCSEEFTFLTGAALIQSNYTANPSIEGLQATIVIAHNVSNLNAHPLVGSFFLHGAIISQAKNLMLHCTDSPRFREEREINGYDLEEVETRRRIWWDITTYDWLLGFLSCPQEWTYQIHPSHMNVNHPMNIDDSAIHNPNLTSSPPSTPTDMSFSLYRLKLAIACREAVDATSYQHLHGLEIPYDKILDLDREMHKSHAEIPEFFRLDPASRRKFAALYRERPKLAWQRCVLQQAYFSRICRLHRRFFIRGAKDPAYSYSHVVCLGAARKVLEIKRIIDEDEPRFTPSSSVVWSVMHHVFMAAVILLLDVCFNWDDILAEKRKEEVLDACRMLSKAQQSSTLVKEGIDAMMGVLRKNWKNGKLSLPGGQQGTGSGSGSGGASSPVLGAVGDVDVGNVPLAAADIPVSVPVLPGPQVADTKELAYEMDINNPDQGFNDRQLEDVWSEMIDNGGNFGLDTTDWTGLMNDLTNSTVPCG